MVGGSAAEEVSVGHVWYTYREKGGGFTRLPRSFSFG
jgi:hypothetical protein